MRGEALHARPRAPLVVIALWQRATRRLCRHRELVRAHVDGVWYFECPCGYRVPMMARASPRRDV